MTDNETIQPAGAIEGVRPVFQIPEVIAKELTRFLEDQIIFGELPPGARLVEEEIVQRFNVSRSPVRETLRSLEQEGLAVRELRRGVRVSPIGIEDLDEVYTCRLALEGLATELAAEHQTKQDIADIQKAVEHLASAYTTGDIREFFRANLTLSTRLHIAARNKTLKRLLNSIGKQSHRYRYLAYSNNPQMMLSSIEGHREIVAAMEKRNTRHARILMEDMIQRSWKLIRDHFIAEAKRG
jgi:DNA-binding GntR family transcriptional regulator